MLHRRPAGPRWMAALLAVAVIGFGGCKTSKESTALATQISATSKALSSYYGALDKELQATDQMNMLGEGLNGTAYDQSAQGQIHVVMTAIEERKAMADALGQVGDAFGKLSGSTSAADAATSAGKLEGAVEGLNLLPGTLNAGQKDALTASVQGLATLIHEHKEREAAAKMADAANKLAAFFASEQSACNSIDDSYADLSRSFAQALVGNQQVDTSGLASSLAASALAPYSLTAKLSDDVRARLEKEAPKEIARESAALKTLHKKASDGMEEALRELAKDIATLAAGKPLATNASADSLGAVNNWVSMIPGK